MKILSNAQINYVIYHLGFFIENPAYIKTHFIFINDSGQLEKHRAKIIFQLTKDILNPKNITYKNNLPIIFPIEKRDEWFYFEDGNLIFTDDLLKSAFYLLSGYQEYGFENLDEFGRFPYEQSIQYKLGITEKPIVNYYFEIILEGIKQFCDLHNIDFKRKKLFENFGFALTHDIDHIDSYDIYAIVRHLKSVIGLRKSPYKWSLSMRFLFLSLFHYIFKLKNPIWNFEYLCKVGKSLNLRSSFYFLHKDLLHKDSYYTFEEKRIKKLIHYLDQNDCEIGLHGTLRSATDFAAMQYVLKKLQSVSPQPVLGGRQHYLKFKHPDTLKIHEKVGLKYDSTLGFAEHVGFRNSYCLPFKLYDFDNDRMIDVWEFPLTTMEVSLFKYQKTSFNQAKELIFKLIDETIKFNGLFTMNWHNYFFDEYEFPGITKFYEEILKEISELNPESVRGIDMLNILEKPAST